ncbi:MAG: type I-E CRISPR-associated protein Cas5/CasD [Pseudohongiella sp.]|nr:type I-E CRISPR-associated protein Cas5/CasD [Pseudohongiella sp.]MDP2129034.1 type I-E CRISPR-associated protein Cas5/CasD [Pseudohongiella sp.]
MSEPYLLLWLEAPLQSWGHDSKFGRRDSLDFPTKSGVLGLLCCALGAGGEQREWLHQLSEFDMQVGAFVRLDHREQAATRLPLLRDFHMVGSGYDDQDPWANFLIPKTSEGKKAVGGGSKMTYRYYLQDMAFAVALQGPINELDKVAEALKNPVWDLYLGRKNCVPTEFIFQGIHGSAESAFKAASQLALVKKRSEIYRVLQGEHEGEVLTLNDVPLQFGSNKQYRDRRVTVQKVE